jgi:hypothetical protein
MVCGGDASFAGELGFSARFRGPWAGAVAGTCSLAVTEQHGKTMNCCCFLGLGESRDCAAGRLCSRMALKDIH